MVDQALTIVGHWLALLLDLLLTVFGTVVHGMRHIMAELHIASGLQTLIMVLVVVALVIVAVRLLGGVVRLLLATFLILLLVRVLMH